MSGRKPYPALSARLRCIADMIGDLAALYEAAPGMCDIGCDHALTGIAALKDGSVSHVCASDLRKGPLQAAKASAGLYGVRERMRFVCADGLDGVAQNEAAIGVICGMGGELIRDILLRGDLRAKGITGLVLSPHTKAAVVRQTLDGLSFCLQNERMVCENGKYYPVLAAVDAHAMARLPGNALRDPYAAYITEIAAEEEADVRRVLYRFGPCLLASHDPVVRAFLAREEERLTRVLARLEDRADVDAENILRRQLSDVRRARMMAEGTGEGGKT